MNKTIIALGALLLGVLVSTSAFAGNAKIIAAGFHADWCASCKVLAPTMKEVKQKYAGSDVKFIKFDKTDDATSAKSLALASDLGIADIFTAHPKTGFALLIDAQSKQVVGKLSKTQTLEEMSQTIDGALAGKNMYEAKDAGSSMKGSDKQPKGSYKGSY